MHKREKYHQKHKKRRLSGIDKKKEEQAQLKGATREADLVSFVPKEVNFIEVI